MTDIEYYDWNTRSIVKVQKMIILPGTSTIQIKLELEDKREVMLAYKREY